MCLFVSKVERAKRGRKAVDKTSDDKPVGFQHILEVFSLLENSAQGAGNSGAPVAYIIQEHNAIKPQQKQNSLELKGVPQK